MTGQVTDAQVPVCAKHKPVDQSPRAYRCEKLKSGMAQAAMLHSVVHVICSACQRLHCLQAQCLAALSAWVKGRPAKTECFAKKRDSSQRLMKTKLCM